MLDVPAPGGAWQFAALWRWSSPSQIEQLVLVSVSAEVPTAELAEHPMLITRHVINSRLFIGKHLASLAAESGGDPSPYAVLAAAAALHERDGRSAVEHEHRSAVPRAGDHRDWNDVLRRGAA